MDRDDDLLLLRDELTRRFDLVLRPSTAEIVRFRDEAARLALLLGDLDRAEREAAHGIFLLRPEGLAAETAPALRSAA